MKKKLVAYSLATILFVAFLFSASALVLIEATKRANIQALLLRQEKELNEVHGKVVPSEGTFSVWPQEIDLRNAEVDERWIREKLEYPEYNNAGRIVVRSDQLTPQVLRELELRYEYVQFVIVD
ncbi:MAG: hypothetical protein KatS3mg111_0116 [Pirellulaceae bacterium]|nr:MAG: hypothetical protein KatS3mg111_0116 [Pirellulaceae bacterium]